jgi:hypothetical protein
MATTVNNTTVNNRVTIIFDAGGPLDGDGPAKGTGNTESDVYLDSKVYLNIRSHTEIDANVHALQWNATTNTGELEYIDNRENESLSSFPQWATNVVIRCEAQDVWQTAYDGHADANAEDDSAAVTAADTARTNYLTAHSITY